MERIAYYDTIAINGNFYEAVGRYISATPDIQGRTLHTTNPLQPTVIDTYNIYVVNYDTDEPEYYIMPHGLLADNIEAIREMRYSVYDYLEEMVELASANELLEAISGHCNICPLHDKCRADAEDDDRTCVEFLREKLGL